MNTTWIQHEYKHEYNIDTTHKQHECKANTTGIQHEHNMDATWTQHEYNMSTTVYGTNTTWGQQE